MLQTTNNGFYAMHFQMQLVTLDLSVLAFLDYLLWTGCICRFFFDMFLFFIFVKLQLRPILKKILTTNFYLDLVECNTMNFLRILFLFFLSMVFLITEPVFLSRHNITNYLVLIIWCFEFSFTITTQNITLEILFDRNIVITVWPTFINCQGILCNVELLVSILFSFGSKQYLLTSEIRRNFLLFVLFHLLLS